MCLICIDLSREMMTTKEARRALGEMSTKDIDTEHRKEVLELIKTNESPDKKQEASVRG